MKLLPKKGDKEVSKQTFHKHSFIPAARKITWRLVVRTNYLPTGTSTVFNRHSICNTRTFRVTISFKAGQFENTNRMKSSIPIPRMKQHNTFWSRLFGSLSQGTRNVHEWGKKNRAIFPIPPNPNWVSDGWWYLSVCLHILHTLCIKSRRSGLSTWKYQFSYAPWCQATLSSVSNSMGDRSSVAANPQSRLDLISRVLCTGCWLCVDAEC